jgi:protein-disulfide isomerase
MHRLAVACVLAMACKSTDELEAKVAQLEEQVAAAKQERDALQKRVDALAKDLKDQRDLDRKIDDLLKAQQRTVDAVSRVAARPSRVEPDRSKTYAVPIGSAPTDGPADAKVTLVWAYDYACPYCERVRETIAELRKKYGNDLRVVYQQFIVHPRNASAAAYAACAANKQRKFSKLDPLLWDKGFKDRRMDLSDVVADNPLARRGSTKCWDEPGGCPIVVDFARQAGLDVAKFKIDMRSCVAEIGEQQHALQQFAVGATPSFFINGRYLSGAMPIDSFAALIDEEMQKANERIAQGTPKSSYYQEWVIDKGLAKVDP